MTEHGTDPDDTAERILKFADKEIGRLPEPQQEEVLLRVRGNIDTWLEAIAAGRAWQQRKRER